MGLLLGSGKPIHVEVAMAKNSLSEALIPCGSAKTMNDSLFSENTEIVHGFRSRNWYGFDKGAA
ncbi:MAG: hypothetical protein KDE54_07860 [Caldilineaceae bacterium]|nr:hypothetical protein [Caldilineaceae bacterium]MCB0140602.1 hypothetical protein [Caldilineaceae bacterium]